MGEIVEDCYDRAMDELENMSDGDRFDFECDWANRRIRDERIAQHKRNNQRSAPMWREGDDPPF